MTGLRFLLSFEDDAVSIWTYIAQHNERAADRLIEEIYDRCLILERHPEAGPARADIAHDCRHLIAGRILILYRIMDDGVELVRALDASRNITSEMFKEE